MSLPNIKRGFTLIEILLVIAILSILLVVVFAALNPAQRLEDTRNARRWNDVNNYLTAIHECIIDNDGDETQCGLTDDGTVDEIVDGAAVTTGCDAVCGGATGDCVNLDTLVTQAYLGSLPTDPIVPATDHTSYSVVVSSGIVTVAACGAEGAAAGTIFVSR
jgi:prepilin-type N-terminal cleavage/methylation domain-containing protein